MKTEHLSVAGMTCGGCTGSVTRALQAVRGVKNVDVSLAEASATVQFDEQLTSSDELVLAVQQAGYGVGDAEVAALPGGGGCCCS